MKVRTDKGLSPLRKYTRSQVMDRLRLTPSFWFKSVDYDLQSWRELLSIFTSYEPPKRCRCDIGWQISSIMSRDEKNALPVFPLHLRPDSANKGLPPWRKYSTSPFYTCKKRMDLQASIFEMPAFYLTLTQSHSKNSILCCRTVYHYFVMESIFDKAFPFPIV